MPLLVVPLAPDDTDLVTLHEWDALRARGRIVFERPDHPLAARLAAEGIDVGVFDDEPDVGMDGWALVADPDSPRIAELARAGADVIVGSATPDALTAAHGAVIGRRAGASFARLAVIMARLRSIDGCPWDREQTHESLRVHLIEEAHEVLEAIEEGRIDRDLEEELGDLLLQVLFHSQLATDDGRFDISDVATAIATKLINRHPHVFGDVSVGDANEVVRNWEAIKAEEKQRSDRFSDIPKGLPALVTAYKTQKRAAGAGFRASEDEARGRVKQLADSDLDAEGLGDLLFWAVAVARARGVDPEGALRSALARFKAGFA